MPESTTFLTWFTLCALAMLVVLALPYVAAQLMRSLEAFPPLVDFTRLDSVQAIVILGGDFCGHAPEMGGDTVGPLTLQRLHYAASLYRSTELPLLVTGGVVGRNARPLSESMASVLANDFGVPTRWIERAACNTMENARLSAVILASEGVGRICLITHGWHMARAKRAFECTGLDVVAAPALCSGRPTPLPGDFVPNEGALCRSFQAIREWGGRLWYGLLHRLEAQPSVGSPLRVASHGSGEMGVPAPSSASDGSLKDLRVASNRRSDD